jgi:hypothetical protein
MRMTAFWDRAQCRLAEVDRRFRGVTASTIMSLTVETLRTSEVQGVQKVTQPMEKCNINFIFFIIMPFSYNTC